MTLKLPDTLWESLSFAKFVTDEHGKRQIVWDVSSLEKFMTCQRLYQYGYLENWRYRYPVPALAWGTGMHAGLEVFDQLTALGVPNMEATVGAMKAAAADAKEGLASSDDNKRTLATLMRAIARYTEHYAHDPVRTALLPDTGKPAVEVRFEVPLPGLEGHRLSGRIDRLGIFEDQIVIVEHKTTDASLTDWYWRRFNPSTQNSGYMWALREALELDVSGVMIDAIQTGVGFTRFERRMFHLTQDQTDEWIREAVTYIKQAEEAYRTQNYPRNFASCGNYGGCKFRGVCSRPAGELRTQWLEEDFIIHTR